MSKYKDIKPLFIWAGGKTKMIKHYVDIIPEDIKTYIEPFFGGGAMLLHIIKTKGLPEKIIINDINVGIVSIYNAIKNDLDAFITALDKYDKKYIPMSKEDRKKYYYSVRQIHAYEYENMTKTEEAACLYFLMKTGFNGIWQINKNTNDRFGTPSGLLNQKDTVYDLANIKLWNEILQNAEIMNVDWFDCIEPHKNEDSFVFLDPPYRGGFTKYGEDFDDNEQEKLIRWCMNSGDDCRTYLCNRDLGDDFYTRIVNNTMNIKYCPVVYTAGRRKVTEDGFEAKPATEVMIYKK